MKKLIALMLAMALAFSLVACGGGDASGDQDGDASGDGTYEYALVTDYGSIDDRSFNQHSWEGLEKYCKEAGKTYKYYRPTEQSNDGYITSIETAIANGAKYVVCPGFSFEVPVYEMQEKYPDVKFIILDSAPAKDGDVKTADNTYSIVFAEEQAGFLAGYAAVKDGYRKLGFMGGMAVPAVIRFGYGYAQGAEYAAKEIGLEKDAIEIMFAYAGGFQPTPDIQAKAAAWYNSGTEIVFSCGGQIINSVAAAAEASDEDKWVIGVDGDQSGESDTVVTSAMKMLEAGVYNALKADGEGNFPGGTAATLGAAEDAVGMPMDTARFKTFSQEDYDAIYKSLKEDTDNLASGLIKDVDENGEAVTIKALDEALEYVTVKDAN